MSPYRLFIGLVLLCAQTALAQTDGPVGESDEANYVPYDSIVQDLQKRQGADGSLRGPRPSRSASGDPFENVWLHAGAGFTQATQNLALPNGVVVHHAGRGIQATLGIDILGPSFAAEGAVRSFGETDESQAKVELKEFDLKVFFKSRPQPSLGLRAGGGLAARYMTVRHAGNTYDLTTPASVLAAGGDLYLSSTVSIGFDLSARYAMINDSFDRSSYDGTIRLDTHF